MKRGVKKSDECNPNQLFELTGAEPKYIKRWLLEAGLRMPDGSPDCRDRDRCVEIIQEHQRKTADDKEFNGDKATGLSWGQSKLREDTMRLRMENEETAKRQSKEWMLAAEHLDVIKSLCTKLDQAPQKMKSQLGLTEEQRVGAQKIIDDIRTEFAKTL